jgi:pimeloyl-ACP methyl ester carboxylesterase
MGPRQRFIEAVGVRTFLREVGGGDETLILIHGAEADSSMWDPYMAGLARDRTVMALDLPGHGRSEAPEDLVATPPGVARWFEAILDQEGLDAVSVLGHSFGGVVAFNLALEASERVSHLVGVNVANLAFATRTFREGAYHLMEALESEDLDEGLVRRTLGAIYQKDPDSPDIVSGAALWSQPGVQRFFRAGGSQFSRSLPIWRLREVTVPTLLVWGSKDRFFPLDEARTSMLYLAQARLVVIDGGGHSPFVDSPDLFYMAVDSFLTPDP